MRYQIKGSTVTFTNQSVNIGDVTGWRWLLDSGSGFAEVATTLNADITFPATAGVTCTVKLLALGPWGATEVKYEEQFMTVENIPGPVIVPKTVSGQSLSTVDTAMEVQAGTGAGQLTWEILGGFTEIYGLTLSSSGRITGLLFSDVNRDIPVKVTDQLGRQDFGTISIVISGTSVMLHTFDFDNGAVVYDPGTMKVSALRNQVGTIIFTEPTAVMQPVFIPDDGSGKACIEFAEDAHCLYYAFANAGATQYRGGFCGRVKTIAGTPFSTSKMIVGTSYTYGAGYNIFGVCHLQRQSALVMRMAIQVVAGYSPAGQTPADHGFLSDFDAVVGSNQCAESPAYASAYNSAVRFNGVRVSSPAAPAGGGFMDAAFHSSAAGSLGISFGATPPGWVTLNKSSERFRLYSFAMWLTATTPGVSPAHPNAATIDSITQYYSRKYGIPCKKITSLTA